MSESRVAHLIVSTEAVPHFKWCDLDTSIRHEITGGRVTCLECLYWMEVQRHLLVSWQITGVGHER